MRSKLMTMTLIGMLSLAGIGCSLLPYKLPAPCGVTDYVDCPKGTKISGVPLPTDEGKTYTVVTPKTGFWISTECDERIGR
jgi:hypothetical protein